MLEILRTYHSAIKRCSGCEPHAHIELELGFRWQNSYLLCRYWNPAYAMLSHGIWHHTMCKVWGPETKNYILIYLLTENLKVNRIDKHETVLWKHINSARIHEIFTKNILNMSAFHNSAISLLETNSWKSCTCLPSDIDEEVCWNTVKTKIWKQCKCLSLD